MSERPAAFLDRDGVLNDVVPDPVTGMPESPLDPADVRLMPGAGEAVELLRGVGYVPVLVSNQPAAAKGKVPVERLRDVQRRVEALLAQEGVELDDARLCLHHPEGTVPGLGGRCDCRKPAPGMLVDAARELGLDLSRSWMFGDGTADVGAARAAGCRMALVEHPLTAHRRENAGEPDLKAATLLDAARLVVDRTR